MSKKLWGGRFKKKTDPDFERFSQSIHFDKKLAVYDVLGSIFHINVLHKSGLLSKEEYKRLDKGLHSILKSMTSGRYKTDLKSEDIHTDIQNKLEKKIGNVALKLHTCRSRNDQVVFDLKWYCKDEISQVIILLSKLANSIQRLAARHKKVKLPGYTHLQHAQPVGLADYLMAYREMIMRDGDRLHSIDIDILLGSGALAGTPVGSKINEVGRLLSKKLGISIKRPLNSIDNVSDRDFIIEILSVLSILQMHLSRMAEDFIIWSTSEFGFVELGDEFCTGSSIMPQKKNPDSLELIRGNTGRFYGNLVSVLTMMKGLPLTYNRDMQLDKQPLFDSIETIKNELSILAKLVSSIRFNRKNIAKQLEDEFLYATNLAYYLVRKGIPFKEAHSIVGRIISYSEEKGVKIKDMPESALKRFSKKITKREITRLLNRG